MSTQAFHRRSVSMSAVCVAFVCLLLAACGSSSSSSSSSGSAGAASSSGSGATNVSLLMNWFPEPETGGFYQAAATGIDAQHGVKFKVLPGGPQVQTIPQVASGQAQFGVSNADQILLARAQGVPVVAIYGTFNKYLQCLMYHKSSGITTPSQINGHQVAVQSGPNYWLWVKAHYHLTGVHEVATTGTLANFKLTSSLVQQCFVTEEPYFAKQQGIDVAYFSVANLGYNPYGNLLFTSEAELKSHPDVVAKVVAAAQAGWTSYLKNPAPANALIKQQQPTSDTGQMKYADQLMKGYVSSPPGTMTTQRWQTLYTQMLQAGLLTKSVNWRQAFTLKFVH